MTPPASLSTGRRQARYRQQPSWRVSVMNLLWLLRIPVILLGVLGLAWLTLLVAGWLQPLRPPRLFVIGGEYQNAQLPVNAFAGRDVTGLLSEAKLFDVVGNETEGRSLNLTEMRQMADRISELPRRQSIFFWRKTTNIVYVNALGLAVRDDSDPQNAKAYLLPREFDAALHRLVRIGVRAQADRLRCVAARSQFPRQLLRCVRLVEQPAFEVQAR